MESVWRRAGTLCCGSILDCVTLFLVFPTRSSASCPQVHLLLLLVLLQLLFLLLLVLLLLLHYFLQLLMLLLLLLIL